jgi:hypothetical protein
VAAAAVAAAAAAACGAGVGAAVAAAAAEAGFLPIKSENMHEYFRGECSTYTNWQQFGANKSDAFSECPNIQSHCQCWRPNRVLSVPQIDLSAGADRKMVNLDVYLRNFTNKSRFYRTDMQIKK